MEQEAKLEVNKNEQIEAASRIQAFIRNRQNDKMMLNKIEGYGKLGSKEEDS